MRENRVRSLWAEGKTALTGWLHISSTWSAEVMANQGWDSLVVDMQHGMMGMETAIQMLQAISTTNTVPMARGNWNTPGDIMKLLDAGAFGIVCPMIETREECEAFVGACLYPPDGYRSLGPTRARVYAGADYADRANDTIITIAMIETQKGYDNREAIMSVEGLDVVFIGIGDLRLCMTGQAGFDASDATLDDALNELLATAQKHDVVAGLFAAGPEHGIEMIRRGYRFVAVMTDTNILSTASENLVNTVRGGMA